MAEGAARSKKAKAPKSTAAWKRYKSENRFYFHQVKQIEKHIQKYSNDQQSISRLQSIRDKRLGITHE